MNLKIPLYFPFAKLFQTIIMSTTSHSSNYERMSGNCTRLIAAQTISTIFPPITSSSYILDNACGPGIVSEQVKLLHPNAKIMATDLAPSMIEQIRQRIETEGWTNMQTDILDIRSLSSLPDNTFTHVITNLGLPVPDDPDSGLKAAREMFRVLQPGGVAVVSTWAGKSVVSGIFWCQTAHNTPCQTVSGQPLSSVPHARFARTKPPKWNGI